MNLVGFTLTGTETCKNGKPTYFYLRGTFSVQIYLENDLKKFFLLKPSQQLSSKGRIKWEILELVYGFMLPSIQTYTSNK